MKITFKTRSSFSILKAVRGRSFRAQCHGLHHTRCRHGLCAERKPLKTSRVKKGNYTVSRIELGNSFPDVLVCTTGDRDLVRRK